MKLIFAVISDEDSNKLLDSLNEGGFGATRLCSTGGFLKTGNTTVIIGTSSDKLEEALEIIKITCQSRTRIISPAKLPGSFASFNMPMPVEIKVGGATVFVVDVEQFIKL